jgi:hypothetical protein
MYVRPTGRHPGESPSSRGGGKSHLSLSATRCKTGLVAAARSGVPFTIMKWLRVVAVLALIPTAIPVHASEKAVYQTGKLVDLRREGTGSGAARAQGSFCLAVEVGDMTYLVSHKAYWRWSYEPTDFVVGDPVEVRIKGNNLYLKKSKDGDLETSITRRERNLPDKNPITCGLPVAIQN